MEDVHVINLDARTEATNPTRTSSAARRLAFFGIWDGHGGVECARYVSERLHANAIGAGLLNLKVRHLRFIQPNDKTRLSIRYVTI